MEGKITVTYTVICDDDIDLTIDLASLFENDKVASLIRREFAKGARNAVLDISGASGAIALRKEKKAYTVVIEKDDFADALTFAEEDARKRKLLRGKCGRIELLDLATDQSGR